MAITFKEIRLPTDIALSGPQGEIEFNTELSQVDDGHIQAMRRWDESIRNYKVTFLLKDYEDLHNLKSFFEVLGGRETAFRYKDHFDFDTAGYTGQDKNSVSSTDVVLSTGSTDTAFQLFKRYTISGTTVYRDRTITKPVSGTVIPAIDGTTLSTAAFSVSTTNGLLTLSSALGSTNTLTVGFEFDVPVHLSGETLPVNTRNFKLGSIDLNLAEVRIEPGEVL